MRVTSFLMSIVRMLISSMMAMIVVFFVAIRTGGVEDGNIFVWFFVVLFVTGMGSVAILLFMGRPLDSLLLLPLHIALAVAMWTLVGSFTIYPLFLILCVSFGDAFSLVLPVDMGSDELDGWS